MAKNEYNPYADFNVERGMAYLAKHPEKRKNAIKANSLEKTVEILKTTPLDIINFGNGAGFDKVFKRIAKTGYVIKNNYGIPINDFSIIDAPKKREIYINLLKEFDLLNKKD